MNSIRTIKELNKRELENGVSTEASWHADYRDTAHIYIGGLPFELSEGDVITMFSQYGEPTYINLIRDKETGKSRGFAFLKYEDQRSTDLAVDNLGGAVIMGRTLKVDHTRYKKRNDEPDDGMDLTTERKQIEEDEDDGDGRRKRRRTSESEEERPMIKEEQELAKLIQDHDEEDPMKAFLVQEKKEEVALALARLKDGKKSEKSHKHRHHHNSRRPKEGDEEADVSRYSRRRKEDQERKRLRSRDAVDARSTSRRREPDRDDRVEEYKSRRRSPRRDSWDRGGHDKDPEPERPRRRGDSRDNYRRRSRRDS